MGSHSKPKEDYTRYLRFCKMQPPTVKPMKTKKNRKEKFVVGYGISGMGSFAFVDREWVNAKGYNCSELFCETSTASRAKRIARALNAQNKKTKRQ